VALIAIVIVIICLNFSSIFVQEPQETKLSAGPASLTAGQYFTVNLSDNESKRLVGENISVTVINASNNKVIDQSILTTKEGGGDYKVKVFYNGTEEYKSSNITMDLHVNPHLIKVFGKTVDGYGYVPTQEEKSRMYEIAYGF
jgi:hypothetical protein